VVEKKEKVQKKYNFVQIIKCEKCLTIAEIPGPCVKCGNEIFIVRLKVQEI